jgi:hypothetical protein
LFLPLIAFLLVIPQGSAVVFVLVERRRTPHFAFAVACSSFRKALNRHFDQSATAKHRHFDRSAAKWRNLLLYPNLFQATVALLSLSSNFAIAL